MSHITIVESSVQVENDAVVVPTRKAVSPQSASNLTAYILYL